MVIFNRLPIYGSVEDAVSKFNASKYKKNDALIAYTASFLSNEGFKNCDIRDLLGEESQGRTSYLIKCGKTFRLDEMNIWFQNPTKITLGHMRALARIKNHDYRKKLINDMRTKSITVWRIEEIIKKGSKEGSVEQEKIVEKIIEQLSEMTGLSLSVKYNERTRKGRVVINFSGPMEFDDILQVIKEGRATTNRQQRNNKNG